MVVMYRYLNKELKTRKALFDVKCSKALEDEIINLGGTPIWYRTGASWTKYGVNKDKLPFGGEFSGHMYFTDRWPGFDSGLYNGLRMLEILSKTNLNFSRLIAGTNKYYSIPETKVRVTDDTKFNIVADVLKYVQD